MPWTRRQVRYLMSSGSPLTEAQKTKMKGELHDNPSMGHMKKGYRKDTKRLAKKLKM
jgi:hypothetical protein